MRKLRVVLMIFQEHGDVFNQIFAPLIVQVLGEKLHLSLETTYLVQIKLDQLHFDVGGAVLDELTEDGNDLDEVFIQLLLLPLPGQDGHKPQ